MAVYSHSSFGRITISGKQKQLGKDFIGKNAEMIFFSTFKGNIKDLSICFVIVHVVS